MRIPQSGATFHCKSSPYTGARRAVPVLLKNRCTMKEHVKHVAIVFGIATAAMLVWNFLAKTPIPGVSTLATKITKG